MRFCSTLGCGRSREGARLGHTWRRRGRSVLRTALTGLHLRRTGELLAQTVVDVWRPRLDELFASLDQARDDSVLPEEPQNLAELDGWLVEHRLVSA